MVRMSQIVSELENAGFVLNVIKSRLKPQQIGQWLGFILDLIAGKFVVLREEVARLVITVKSILASV